MLQGDEEIPRRGSTEAVLVGEEIWIAEPYKLFTVHSNPLGSTSLGGNT